MDGGGCVEGEWGKGRRCGGKHYLVKCKCMEDVQ